MSDSEESTSARDIPSQTFRNDEVTEADSIYSEPYESDSSSSIQNISSARGRSRKRKTKQDLPSSHSRVKRLKGSYNDKYRRLFNETIGFTVSDDAVFDSTLPPSQIGVTRWSPEEKERFFVSLARRGRHNIRSIASQIGSKSESQVTIYLEKLQNAADEEQTYEVDPRKLLKGHEVDAAVEISQICCARLSVAAEALSVLQQKEEERLEKKKHRDYSFLTAHIAKVVDHQLRVGELSEDMVSKTVPAAVLLNLREFITLSKRFFMNSSDMENNWRSYTERPKGPSIMYTAFSDFHNLTLSLTKKLVQSSLFLAMSRIKATSLPGYRNPGRHVRRRDVVAALDVLDLQHNSMKSWAGTARKCKLRVHENVRHRQASGKRYDYDEVEDLLSCNQYKSRVRSVSRMTDKSTGRTSEQSEEEMDLSADDTEDSNLSTNLSPEDEDSSSSSATIPSDDDLSSHRKDKRARRRKHLEEAQGFYAEALDQRASRKEEYQLWEVLGEDPDTKMDVRDSPFPRVPASTRKSRDDLIDWRNWINYVAEWESFRTPVPASAFAENRRKEKGAGLASSLSGSDYSSDDGGEVRSSSQIPLEVARSANGSASESSNDSDGTEDRDETRALLTKSVEQTMHDVDDNIVEESSEQDVFNDGSSPELSDGSSSGEPDPSSKNLENSAGDVISDSEMDDSDTENE